MRTKAPREARRYSPLRGLLTNLTGLTTRLWSSARWSHIYKSGTDFFPEPTAGIQRKETDSHVDRANGERFADSDGASLIQRMFEEISTLTRAGCKAYRGLTRLRLEPRFMDIWLTRLHATLPSWKSRGRCARESCYQSAAALRIDPVADRGPLNSKGPPIGPDTCAVTRETERAVYHCATSRGNSAGHRFSSVF